MREQLYACEERYLVSWLERRENATAAELSAAAAMFPTDDSERDPTGGIYAEIEGVATITIEGPLTNAGPSVVDRFFGFGGTGYRNIMAAMARARERKPRSVVLSMNTPGGEVAGVDQVWQAGRAMSAEIPTHVEVRGMLASGGVWIASSAPRIVATSPADEIGSIGVIIVGFDDSKMGEKLGIRRVKIVSKHAPRKGADMSSAEGRSVLQERADSIESVFIERVATGRGVSVETVSDKFGQGGLMIARDALTAGLIDAIEPAVKPAERVSASVAVAHTPAPVAVTTADPRRSPMTLSELIAANPGVQAEYTKALADAKASGVAETHAQAKTVGKYLVSDVYSRQRPIVERVVKALQGEGTVESVESAVAMFDLLAEQTKQTAAGAEASAQPETPPQQAASPSAELQAKLAQHRIDVQAVTYAAQQAGTDPTKALQAEVEMREQAERDSGKAGA